jgi:hypothetical protein
MIINFTPQRGSPLDSVVVVGDTIILNGEEFIFSPLDEGEAIPYSAIGSEFFKFGEPVRRTNGSIVLTLISPAEGPAVEITDGDVEVPK